MSKSKQKLKTLPNELIETNACQLMFKSACDENLMQRINLASPTFATEVVLTVPDSETGKENVEDGALRERQTLVKGTTSNKKQFHEMENKKLVQRSKALEKENQALKESLELACKKLEHAKKSLEKKVDSCLMKFRGAENSCSEKDNIDIYLELMTFKKNYKQLINENKKHEREAVKANAEIEDLKTAILKFTEKEVKSGKKEHQHEQKMEKKYKSQIEELRRDFSNRHQLQEEKIQCKVKQINKLKQEYNKIKFLKEEIEKKRQEDIRFRDEASNDLQLKEDILGQLKAENQALNGHCATLKQECEALREESDALKCHNSQILERCKSLEMKVSNDVSQERNKISQYDRKCKQLCQSTKQKDLMIEQLKKNLQSMEQLQVELHSQVQRFEVNEKMLNTQISCYQSENHRLEKQFQQVTKQLSEKQRQNQSRISTEHYDSKIEELTEKMEEFNSLIAELRRCKRDLQADLDKEKEINNRLKEDYLKASQDLQDSYRKIEEFEEDYRICTNLHDSQASKPPSALFQSYRPQGIPTKTLSQLQMVKDIFCRMLKGDTQGSFKYSNHSTSMSTQIETSMAYIVELGQQAADYFDVLVQKARMTRQEIRNKEEVITKLLRFTPNEKKTKILEYLNVMENYHDYTADQINHANLQIKEEAENWKRKVEGLTRNLEQCEEENVELRKALRNRETPGLIRNRGYAEKEVYASRDLDRYTDYKYAEPRRKYLH